MFVALLVSIVTLTPDQPCSCNSAVTNQLTETYAYGNVIENPGFETEDPIGECWKEIIYKAAPVNSVVNNHYPGDFDVTPFEGDFMGYSYCQIKTVGDSGFVALEQEITASITLGNVDSLKYFLWWSHNESFRTYNFSFLLTTKEGDTVTVNYLTPIESREHNFIKNITTAPVEKSWIEVVIDDIDDIAAAAGIADEFLNSIAVINYCKYDINMESYSQKMGVDLVAVWGETVGIKEDAVRTYMVLSDIITGDPARIDYNFEGEGLVEVYGIHGGKLRSCDVYGKGSVCLDELARGIYIVCYRQKGTIPYTRKLVIAR